MPSALFLLDLLGTFAFAAVGAEAALERRFDLFGVAIAGFLAAFAGGTVREVLLGGLPPYLADNAYALAAGAGVVFAILFYRNLPKLSRVILAIDAIGLAAFAVLGASRASEEGLGAFAIVALATLTAVGGGLARDIALRETPAIFYRDFYASPAILGGVLYAMFRPWMALPPALYTLIAVIFAVRMTALQLRIGLWHPWSHDHD